MSAKKQPKAKAVKAVSAYANTDLTEFSTDWAVISEGHNGPKCDPVPVKVIDISDTDALVEQAAWASADTTFTPSASIEHHRTYARAILASLGIIPARKAKK